MSPQEEEARIAVAVQKQVQEIIAEQQKQFAQRMELALKDALKGVEAANEALKKEHEVLLKELDVAKAASAKAEREGDRMAQAYFENKQKQFIEAIRTELLRDLIRMHLETGKTTQEIAVWLDVPMDFIENIRQIMARASAYGGENPKRLRIEGSPTLRYDDQGRGGLIQFQSRATTFNLWWEFAGGDALVIVEIPTADQWESRTRLPLEQRERTLTYIAEQIVEDKISGNGSFIIGENVITLYAGK